MASLRLSVCDEECSFFNVGDGGALPEAVSCDEFAYCLFGEDTQSSVQVQDIKLHAVCLG